MYVNVDNPFKHHSSRYAPVGTVKGILKCTLFKTYYIKGFKVVMCKHLMPFTVHLIPRIFITKMLFLHVSPLLKFQGARHLPHMLHAVRAVARAARHRRRRPVRRGLPAQRAQPRAPPAQRGATPRIQRRALLYQASAAS